MQRININQSNECWEWTGYINAGGYGNLGGRLAHRLSYVEFVGEIKDGMDICHKCDNRKCINPAHLFQGTRFENMADAVNKNRQASGESLPHAKLTVASVCEIRSLHEEGYGYRRLARKYQVSQTAIKKVLTRQTWRNV